MKIEKTKADYIIQSVRQICQSNDDKNKKLARINDVFVDREFRIKELKENIEFLKQEIEILKKGDTNAG